MDVISYLLFVFTRIIFIRIWKNQVSKTSTRKKFEHTQNQVENSHDKN
jgi:hypothetical protein